MGGSEGASEGVGERARKKARESEKMRGREGESGGGREKELERRSKRERDFAPHSVPPWPRKVATVAQSGRLQMVR